MSALSNILWQRGVMAIVNVTPDSFYAASRLTSESAVAERVERAIAEGASILDIGGYSSRPNADDISVEEEWYRLKMALSAARLVDATFPISLDTFRSEIVRRAYEEFGEFVVNDITGGSDLQMWRIVAEHRLPYIAMHMRGTPSTMQSMTHYEDVVAEVKSALQQRVYDMEEAGIDKSSIMLDVGFGFAKSAEQNFQLLAHLRDIADIGQPLLVGISRKSMIYKTLGITAEQSLAPTQALHWEALRGGATMLRVHDVAEAVQTLQLFEKISER